MTHEEYTEKLKRGVFEVTFNKINGEQRIMNCTLHPRVLPKATKEDTMSQTKVRELNEEVVSVWDVKAEGWRAFRVENVTDFKTISDEMVKRYAPNVVEGTSKLSNWAKNL